MARVATVSFGNALLARSSLSELERPRPAVDERRTTQVCLGIFRVCSRARRIGIILKSTFRRTGMESPDYRGARSYAAAGARLIHPMLMVFPIALLVAVLATDLAFWGTGDRFWAHAAEWLLAIG